MKMTRNNLDYDVRLLNHEEISRELFKWFDHTTTLNLFDLARTIAKAQLEKLKKWDELKQEQT